MLHFLQPLASGCRGIVASVKCRTLPMSNCVTASSSSLCGDAESFRFLARSNNFSPWMGAT